MDIFLFTVFLVFLVFRASRCRTSGWKETYRCRPSVRSATKPAALCSGCRTGAACGAGPRCTRSAGLVCPESARWDRPGSASCRPPPCTPSRTRPGRRSGRKHPRPCWSSSTPNQVITLSKPCSHYNQTITHLMHRMFHFRYILYKE